MTNIQATVTPIDAQLKAAVIAEMKLLINHMREDVEFGKPIDTWILDGLQWYEDER